ncbi:MAG: hypothetical protein HN948_07895, partial [Clostridia bacterium]|nr:hypothetical protein [Clostridia bacterium]
MDYTVMSNVHDETKHFAQIVISDKERNRLRELAAQWIAIANEPIMTTRKRQWKAVRDLKPERPMILFETFTVSGFLTDDELLCENEMLRNVEKFLLYGIRQYNNVGDDIVLEKYFRIPWKIHKSDYGVSIVEHHADDSMGYMSNFPIHTPDDLDKLKERTFEVDRNETLGLKNALEEIFGDILPVKVGNYDNFFADSGFNPFCGLNFVGTTMDAFKLMGNDNLLMWPYDHPEAVHRIMRFLTDDRIRYFNWMKDEGLFDFNTDNQFAGPSGYGYVSDLPAVGTDKQIELTDLWVWPESQECAMVSPPMFDEFYLKYIAEVANMFGMAYYGCCEEVGDRFIQIKNAIPNLRTVSVSGWNDFEKVAEMIGKDYVYCRKPTPAHMSN